MVSLNRKTILSALLALGAARSTPGAIAADQSCVNVGGAEDGLTHNFCFEECGVHTTTWPGEDPQYRRIPNLANSPSNSFRDSFVEYDIVDGRLFCDSEGMNFFNKMAYITEGDRHPEGALTIAIVVKFDPTGCTGGQNNQVFTQLDRIGILSFPEMYVRVRRAASNSYRWHRYHDAWSTSEFMTAVTTISNTSFISYKNGVALTADEGNPADNTHDENVRNARSTRIMSFGMNYGCKGTIKSIAIWTRALSAEEVAGLGTPPAVGWDLAFVNMTADFDAQSGNEVVAEYEVSKGRAHEVSLFASRCEAAAGNRVDVTPGVVAVTATSSPKNATHSALVLAYDFNKTLVGSSNIWNETSGMIEFCQRLRLVLGNMTIAEDVREFGLNITLDADFNFTSGLDPETVEEADGAAALDGFLNAFKCDGGSFGEDSSALGPNDYLYVCIESIQDGVEIESLESLVIDQVGITTFQAIDDGAALYPSLTSTTYAEDDKVWVATRLPIDAFDFEALNASISVSGNAVLKFADGSGRRLQGIVGAGVVGEGVVDSPARESRFELEVKLANPGAGDYAYATSPAERVSGAVLLVLGVLSASFW